MRPTIDDVRAAAARIAPHARRTPVMTSRTLDAIAGARLFFKCENFQRVGAFKFRGAANAVFSLTDAEAARGVATHSSGNHAQALALAARLRGIPARIVVPKNAPAVKRAAVAGYGAEIVLCEPTLAARESTTAEIVERTGATLVHPYDDDRVIAGQGTAALELIEEVAAREDGGRLDAIVAPIGGGGLLSGTAIVARALLAGDPDDFAGPVAPVRVVGAEPAGADDARRSLRAGRVLPSVDPQTFADGLLTSLSERTFAIVRDLAEDVALAEDAATLAAMRLVWERMKIVIEPSAAVAAAVALSGAFAGAGRVGVILSGGNVDLEPMFPRPRPSARRRG